MVLEKQERLSVRETKVEEEREIATASKNASKKNSRRGSLLLVADDEKSPTARTSKTSKNSRSSSDNKDSQASSPAKSKRRSSIISLVEGIGKILK